MSKLRSSRASAQLSRRRFVQSAVAAAAGTMLERTALAAETALPAEAAPAKPAAAASPPRAYLTPADRFTDVSRGNPKPFTLTGAAREAARLTPDTWRLEIDADPFIEEPVIKLPATVEHPRTIAKGGAIDFAQLQELGKKHQVSFLKAMQCLNISTPLGQGLWTGVPLREVLRHFCGTMSNVRRIYFWGFHNDDPRQMFRSSLSYTQVMETPPGELPAFIAYHLNGEPISRLRGGPVRMIVPWAHGFKSIKWLQQIRLTNDFRANDTYANSNNDPESFLKTAAYLDKAPEKRQAGQPLRLTGQAVCGISGLKRVEYWVRSVGEKAPALADDDAELLRGPWTPCELDAEPDWAAALPPTVAAKDLLGFDAKTGRAVSWPMRYSLVGFSATITDLAPGRYEIRARAVDQNDFAQPEPRPAQKTGKNAIQLVRVEVA